jgi:hypothetical protein
MTNRREPGPNRMHIIVMSADGQTRRLSLSGGIFWIFSLFVLIILAALFLSIHFLINAHLENRRLADALAGTNRIAEIREYSKTVDQATEEAKRILEILDRAILAADNSGNNDASMIGVPDETEDAPPSDLANDQNDETTENQEPLSALDNAWAQFHARMTIPQGQAQPLDTDEFKLSSNGNVSFLLQQKNNPGQRVRGRTAIVFAVSDASGNISLIAAPPFDLNKPETGWENGSKYNIIASKVVNAKIDIPQGGKVLNAEVLAWDEETKELVFRKKIKIEER